MTRVGLALLVAAAAALGLAGAAGADNGRLRIERAQAVAVSIAGHDVCGGHVRIDRRAFPPDAARRDQAAAATWIPAAQGAARACVVTLNSRVRLYWALLCTAMAHEYLHLAGWLPPPGEELRTEDGQLDPWHSRDRGHLMSSPIRDPHPACSGSSRADAARAGAAR